MRIDFPDVEQLLVDTLDAAVTAEVSTRVPNPRPGEFVRVLRTGGPRTMVSDRAQVTVEAFANRESRAAALAGEARSAVHAMQGTMVGEWKVDRVEELAGPANLPDPTTNQSRYTFTASVHVRIHEQEQP